MMLPLSELEFCYTEDLQVGDFAYLPDFSSSRVLVVKTSNGQVFAVGLDFQPGQVNIAELDEIRGPAIRVQGWTLEVDPQSQGRWDRSADAMNTLVMYGDELRIVVQTMRAPAAFPVTKLPEALPTGIEVAFPYWRIVKGSGDDRRVLFEKSS